MDEPLAATLQADPYTIAAFAGYLLLVLGIGIYAARFSSAGVSEFFVGGRVMNRWVVALSAVVSGRSAWLLLGLTGMAYVMGPAALWAAAGYIVVELLLFLFYAPRLRRFAEAFDCVTITDFFAARFGDERGRLRVLIALILLLFMVGYVAAQFVAGGKAFSATFGVGFGTGLLLTAGIVLLYTLLGGFLGVSLTDAAQAVFMLAALAALPLLAAADLGGWGAVTGELRAMDPALVDPFALTLGAFLGFVGIGLGSPGNPHILVRYMSIKDPRQLRFAAFVGTFWNVVMAAGAVAIGMVARVAIPDLAALPAADPENVLPALAQVYLHPVVLGVVVAAIMAAIMSTADSQLLVAASSVVRDVYEKVIHRHRGASQQRLVLYSRIVVVILVGISLLLGVLAEEMVFWLVLFAWAGLGAALGPTSILALFWRGTTRAGVMAGIVTGTATTLVWYYTPVLRGAIYELIPAFLLSTLVTVLVSRYTLTPVDTERAFRAMQPPREIVPEELRD
jgi:sodium/proline symporter